MYNNNNNKQKEDIYMFKEVTETDLKSFRKKYRIAQVEMAKFCDVSLPTYILWERGVSTPNDENKLKLERAIKQIKRTKSK